MPAEAEWIIQRWAADPTSGSLQGEIRRGTFIVPTDVEWIVKRDTTDPTSGSPSSRRGMPVMPVELKSIIQQGTREARPFAKRDLNPKNLLADKANHEQ
jgi:hypothetical protein